MLAAHPEDRCEQELGNMTQISGSIVPQRLKWPVVVDSENETRWGFVSGELRETGLRDRHEVLKTPTVELERPVSRKSFRAIQ